MNCGKKSQNYYFYIYKMLLKQNYELYDGNHAWIFYDNDKNIMIINVLISEEGLIFQNLYYVLTLKAPDTISLQYMSGVFEYINVSRQIKAFRPSDSQNDSDAYELLRYYLEQLSDFVRVFIVRYGLF